jgi:hypothetical protein
MKILNKLTGICLCLLLSVQLFAQDVIQTHLTANPVLINKWNELQAKGNFRTASVTDTVMVDTTLGFLDDFSYPGPYPDTTLWLDKGVFINRDYPYSPPTIGVATFDGLNEKGYPYNFLAGENTSGLADYLTSKPLEISMWKIEDSVYFSFYYQPQGRGNAPTFRDSLVLEFKSPGATTWERIWSKPGSSITFKDTLSWKLVMIPIINPAYLKRGFQFRFKNYATVSGSLDHWHIDYVYLKRNRKITDTDFQDVSYAYNHPPLIKTYQVMPWRQYTTEFSKDSITILVKNIESKPKNTASVYKITDKNGISLYNMLGSKNAPPFSTGGYYKLKYKFDSIPPFEIPLMTGQTSYYAEGAVTSLPDIKRANDTIRYEQKFENFFAYDDGTAETAFGLTKVNTELAIKFELNVVDTLRYIDIYFNPILTDASLYTFNLKVWADGGGVPGAELFKSRELKPRYSNDGLNGLIRYGLNTSLILPKGIFYVGFMQNTNKPLNVGLDLNTNNQYNTFYNTGTGWNTFPVAGSALLHPVFGTDSGVISVSEINPELKSVEIYPNPANNDLHVRAVDYTNNKITYSIIDIFGREMENKIVTIPATIDISALSEGIYFIRMSGEQINSTFKFIKIE